MKGINMIFGAILIFFFIIYGGFYKEAGIEDKYKFIMPDVLMKIISFPANLIRKIPLVNKIFFKRQVKELSLVGTLVILSLMFLMVGTYIFLIIGGLGWIALTGLWLFAATYCMILIINVLYDFNRRPKKTFLGIIGKLFLLCVCFGTFITLALLCNEDVNKSGYTMCMILGITIELLGVFWASFVEPTENDKAEDDFETEMQKAISEMFPDKESLAGVYCDVYPNRLTLIPTQFAYVCFTRESLLSVVAESTIRCYEIPLSDIVRCQIVPGKLMGTKVIFALKDRSKIIIGIRNWDVILKKMPYHVENGEKVLKYLESTFRKTQGGY